MSNGKNELFGKRLVYDQNKQHFLDKSSLEEAFLEFTLVHLEQYSQSINSENLYLYLYNLSNTILGNMSNNGCVNV